MEGIVIRTVSDLVKIVDASNINEVSSEIMVFLQAVVDMKEEGSKVKFSQITINSVPC